MKMSLNNNLTAHPNVGRKIGKICMLLHRLVLIALFAFEVLLLLASNLTFEDLQQKNASLSTGKNNPRYNSLEFILSRVFNDSFFRALAAHGEPHSLSLSLTFSSHIFNRVSTLHRILVVGAGKLPKLHHRHYLFGAQPLLRYHVSGQCRVLLRRG